MDNDNIYMDLPAVEEKLTALRNERAKMYDALTKIKDEILKMPDVWNGNSGDAKYEVLIKYSKNFTDIIAKIDSFIDALQKAKDSYQVLDNDIIARMEENAEIGATE
jgi:uncharacterized protein YukE